MRLEPTDAECQRLGLPRRWRPEADQIARDRYGALAWMVAAGLLEVRIALPLDHAGNPLYPGQGGALFHPKVGIVYNGAGNILTFQGSVNETGAAWTRNREKFEVHRNWVSDQDVEDIRAEIEEFEAIWNDRDPGLLVLPLPRAVREHLRAFERPDGPPHHDPMLRADVTAPSDLRDRIAAQWLLDAPRKPGGEALVLDPIWVDGQPFEPFPHQAKVHRQVVANFPRSYLFCDEVGLGKTIEAGLVLRSLILKGELKRVLIVAPRNLVRQWMEELREKFALTAWFFNGQKLDDVGGRIRRTSDPWAEDGIVIVSRHLIARQERFEGVLAARPWDAVVVDEAHAARRRVFGGDEPNLLLRLLQAMADRHLFRCLWLLTATPMQLAAYEVHDLLLLTGVDDHRWGPWRDLRRFEGFFDRLRDFAADKEARAEVVDMTRQAVDLGAPDLSPDEAPPPWQPVAVAGPRSEDPRQRAGTVPVAPGVVAAPGRGYDAVPGPADAAGRPHVPPHAPDAAGLPRTGPAPRRARRPSAGGRPRRLPVGGRGGAVPPDRRTVQQVLPPGRAARAGAGRHRLPHGRLPQAPGQLVLRLPQEPGAAARPDRRRPERPGRHRRGRAARASPR